MPPGTTDSTPSGRPASANTSAKAFVVSGVSAAGLSTTVQPASSAGPSLLTARNSGTFHATIAPTTPIGSRMDDGLAVDAVADLLPLELVDSGPAKKFSAAIARHHCIMSTMVGGWPVSAAEQRDLQLVGALLHQLDARRR